MSNIPYCTEYFLDSSVVRNTYAQTCTGAAYIPKCYLPRAESPQIGRNCIAPRLISFLGGIPVVVSPDTPKFTGDTAGRGVSNKSQSAPQWSIGRSSTLLSPPRMGALNFARFISPITYAPPLRDGPRHA